MAKEESKNKDSARSEDSYRAAKLIRSGSRELARQYNSKKAKRQR